MNNYLNLLGILSFIGAITAGLIYYKKNNTNKKQKKNAKKLMIPLKYISIILSLVFIVCATITGIVDPISNTTAIDAQKNGVTALSIEERDKKEWDDFVNKNTKSLSTGEYTIGKDIDEGIYIIEFKENGTLIIKNEDGRILVNSLLNPEDSSNKYKGKLSNKYKLIIENSEASFTPVKNDTSTYNVELYSGQWVGGEDIHIGNYIINAKGRSGNVTIRNSENKIKFEEYMGTNLENKNLKITIEKGDTIYISSLESVTFEPTTN